MFGDLIKRWLCIKFIATSATEAFPNNTVFGPRACRGAGLGQQRLLKHTLNFIKNNFLSRVPIFFPDTNNLES